MKSLYAARLVKIFTLLFVLCVISTISAQEKPVINLKEMPTRNPHGYIHEARAREQAIAMLMPSYPENLLREESSGIIEAKIEIERTTGSVIRAIVQPDSNLEMRKVIYLAIKQWAFKPLTTPYMNAETTVITKLTYHYVVKDGKGLLELYTPPSDTPLEKQLGSYYPRAELQEWMQWSQAN